MAGSRNRPGPPRVEQMAVGAVTGISIFATSHDRTNLVSLCLDQDPMRVGVRSQADMKLLSRRLLHRSDRRSCGVRRRLRVRNEIVEVSEASRLPCLCACAQEFAIGRVNQSASLISAGPLYPQNFSGRSM